MRAAMMAVLIASVVAGLSTVAEAQKSRFRQNQGVSQEAYNRCFQLALRRGQNTSVGDRRSLDLFIDACLRGKIPF